MNKVLVKVGGTVAAGVTSLFFSTPSVFAQYDYDFDVTSTADDTVGLGLFGASLICQIVACIVGLVFLVFTILMIVDAVQRDDKVLPGKIKWIILMVLTGGIGALIYYFTRKKKMGPVKKQAPQQMPQQPQQ